MPHLFLATGADKWANPREFPWTIGWQPSYRVEAQIYAKHILETKPNARIALLYQNDDFGKDYLHGLKDVLGPRFDAMVKTATNEATDPTVDSQIVQLQAGGADTLVCGIVPRHAAQAIRRVHDIGWRPHVLHDQCLDLGRRGDDPGGAGEGRRRHHLRLPQGPGRPGLGQTTPA